MSKHVVLVVSQRVAELLDDVLVDGIFEVGDEDDVLLAAVRNEIQSQLGTKGQGSIQSIDFEDEETVTNVTTKVGAKMAKAAKEAVENA
jgi:hypothetical protein